MKQVKFDGGKVLNIYVDGDSESPRTWDNLGNCIFFHSKYCIADAETENVPNISPDDYNNFDEMLEALKKEHNVVVALPVYLYDHSGQTISTTPFSCKWDSGQLGFIVAYRNDIIKEYNVKKRISAKVKKTVEKCLEAEIETLDQWIRNDIFGYRLLDAAGEELDACWGFYGDSADNGMFDHFSSEIEGLTLEAYTELFNAAEYIDEDEVEDYLEDYY